MKKNKKMTLQEKELRKVTKKLDKEMSKREDKIDMNIVNECFRRLNELQGGVCQKTDAELTEGLNKVKRNGDRIKAEIAKNEIARSCEALRKMPLRKSFALAALSVLLVIGLSFSVLALSLGGYSKAWTYVADSVKTLFNRQNFENTVDGVTIIKGDYRKKYNNIEELLISEKIDMLFPSKLPNEVKITDIRYINIDNEKIKIIVSFNSTNFNMYFYNYHQNDLSLMEQCQKYETEFLTFYIFSTIEKNQTIYGAYAQKGNCEYNINSDNYENLIFMISNLKEVNK